MRVPLGIAISLPIAAIFCLAYLTALVREIRRDARLSRREVCNVPLQQAAWSGPIRTAA